MAGTFEAFGNEVRSTMAGFAESVSGEIISSISPIIYTGIMIYFLPGPIKSQQDVPKVQSPI